MENNPSPSALDDLLARISAVLRGLPGAQELYLFGSAADPALKDPCSDLDLQVISAQIDLSRAAWFHTLSQAGKIALVYPLHPEDLAAQETAFTIGFEGESLYHKVDFGMTAQNFTEGFFNQTEHKILLWQQAPSSEPVIDLPGSAWFPEWGTPGHFLLGELLSSVRYGKARRRRQHLVCWRFLSAKLNALVRCYQWDRNPFRFPGAALSTWDFAALDRRLSEGERLGLMSGLKTASPAEMDRSLVEITRRIAAQIDPGYNSKDTREATLVREILSFIESDLLVD